MRKERREGMVSVTSFRFTAGPGDCDGMLLSHRALSLERSPSVQVADRDGQSVGSSHRLRRLGQFKKSCDHMLYLLLLGPSVADDGGLDSKRRILSDLESGRSRGQHRDSAHLTQFKC